jgi:exodeoxyribonuclease VII large subunit
MIIKNQNGYVGHFQNMIKALSPDNTLKRGFAIVKVNNNITSDPDKIAIGKDIEIIVSKKSITATVKSKKDYHGKDFNV